MTASTAAGTIMSIGSNNVLDPTIDTYIAVGEVVTLPEFGRQYNEISYKPLATRGVQKFKGSFDDGSLAISVAKDLGNAGQAAVLVARDVDLDYNFKVVANDAVAPNIVTGIAISVATPGLVTDTAHGLPAGTAVKFTVGTVPTGLTLGTTYYICAGATLLVNTYALATSYANAILGTGITTTGSPGAGLTRTTIPASSIQYMKAKVLSFTTKYDNVDAVVMATLNLSIKSGSILEIPHLP